MGAQDIINALKNNRKELTAQEIAELVDITTSSVNRAIRALMKYTQDELKAKELTEEEKIERYGHPVNVKVMVYSLFN